MFSPLHEAWHLAQHGNNQRLWSWSSKLVAPSTIAGSTSPDLAVPPEALVLGAMQQKKGEKDHQGKEDKSYCEEEVFGR